MDACFAKEEQWSGGLQSWLGPNLAVLTCVITVFTKISAATKILHSKCKIILIFEFFGGTWKFPNNAFVRYLKIFSKTYWSPVNYIYYFLKFWISLSTLMK